MTPEPGGMTMTWARFDDLFPEHPKLVGLSDGAFRLYVRGVCYCNRHLTDGWVPEAWVGDQQDLRAAELVAGGLWLRVAKGWVVHDYHQYQPTRDEVEARRRVRSNAGRLGGIASAQARAAASGSASRHAVLEAKSHPIPVPFPKEERGGVITNTLTRRKHSLALGSDDDFERFWSMYPRFRRSGKAACHKIWSGLSKEIRAEVLGNLSKWAALWSLAAPERWNFCPMPSTFLNQRRDLDDLTAVSRMVAGDEPGAHAQLQAKIVALERGQETARAKAAVQEGGLFDDRDG